MFKELDCVVLTVDIEEEGLKAGDAGTIVNMYPSGAFMVEFMTLDGDTIALVDVLPSQTRPATSKDITHTRSVEAAVRSSLHLSRVENL